MAQGSQSSPARDTVLSQYSPYSRVGQKSKTVITKKPQSFFRRTGVYLDLIASLCGTLAMARTRRARPLVTLRCRATTGHAELSPLMILCCRKIRLDYHMKGNAFGMLFISPCSSGHRIKRLNEKIPADVVNRDFSTYFIKRGAWRWNRVRRAHPLVTLRCRATCPTRE